MQPTIPTDQSSRSKLLTIAVSAVAVIFVVAATAWLLLALNVKKTPSTTPGQSSKTDLKTQADASFKKAQQLIPQGDTAAAKTELQNAKELYQKAGDRPRAKASDTRLSLIEHAPQPTKPTKQPAGAVSHNQP